MTVHVLEREQVVRAPLDRVFAFFSEARNLERITPPWLRFEVLAPEPVQMRVGTTIGYRLRLHGAPLRWLTLIESWEPGVMFADRQLHGPYRLWHHTHAFAAHPDGTLVRDRVRYELPLGRLGAIAHRAFVARDLTRVFDYRRRAVTRELEPAQNLTTFSTASASSASR
ncbi:MAG: SRPBCC family protein [Solirubrobacterales bacterium]|nr:SRPBCC family protein [Solirubrobacterales bacterium]MBV9715324.1 SRPBCC family protein [Solirubrobacterales bacterium]